MQRRSSSSVKVFYPELTRAEVIRLLSERLKELNEKLPLVRAVLFGSYARGNYTAGSDIDLLIVYRGEEREEAYTLARKVLDLPRLEPHVYAEPEYAEMEKTVQAMTRDGIVLLPSAGGERCSPDDWKN
ncbi:MAG: nucleotidyltransferase domain-containing protein [Firmicutes bacterium]|nr:nucleotidyltransferase domain-containing protein [Bacillota bacterium]